MLPPHGHGVPRADGSSPALPRFGPESSWARADRMGHVASTLRGVGSEVRTPSGSPDVPFDSLHATKSRKKSRLFADHHHDSPRGGESHQPGAVALGFTIPPNRGSTQRSGSPLPRAGVDLTIPGPGARSVLPDRLPMDAREEVGLDP